MNGWIIAAGVAFFYLLMNNTSGAVAVGMYKYDEVFTTVNSYSASLSQYSGMYGIPYTRIAAIIACESSGQANPQPSPGAAGEIGCMQMTPGALKTVNDTLGLGLVMEDMYNPADAIQAGTAYLSLLYGKCKNLDTATRGYNVGIGHAMSDPTAGGPYLARVKNAELTASNILNNQS